MNRLIFASLSAFALTMSVGSKAQQLPAAVVAIVDRDRIASCTQCIAATEQLGAQTRAYLTRGTQLAAALRPETQAIRAALDGLPQGTQPSGPLLTRIRTLQTTSEQGQRELSEAQSAIHRNQQYVRHQVLDRMNPLIRVVMLGRGANITIDVGSTLAIDPALNVTDTVLVLMNQNPMPFNVVAPPEFVTQPNPPRP